MQAKKPVLEFDNEKHMNVIRKLGSASSNNFLRPNGELMSNHEYVITARRRTAQAITTNTRNDLTGSRKLDDMIWSVTRGTNTETSLEGRVIYFN